MHDCEGTFMIRLRILSTSVIPFSISKTYYQTFTQIKIKVFIIMHMRLHEITQDYKSLNGQMAKA